jgi:hypothetical protein
MKDSQRSCNTCRSISAARGPAGVSGRVAPFFPVLPVWPCHSWTASRAAVSVPSAANVPARLYPQRDDILLLCSDGLSNKVSNENMERIILDNIDQLDAACSELVKEANERGGEDNITLIIARLTGSELPEPTEDGIKVEAIDLGNIHDTDDQDTAEIV